MMMQPECFWANPEKHFSIVVIIVTLHLEPCPIPLGYIFEFYATLSTIFQFNIFCFNSWQPPFVRSNLQGIVSPMNPRYLFRPLANSHFQRTWGFGYAAITSLSVESIVTLYRTNLLWLRVGGDLGATNYLENVDFVIVHPSRHFSANKEINLYIYLWNVISKFNPRWGQMSQLYNLTHLGRQ